jgi:uncharacterized RDD family membrane protein YckC
LSDYGNPPQDPNTQPNPYGQPADPYAQQTQQPGYGQPAYGTPAYGQPAYGGAPAADYASWGKRVGAYLIDGLVVMVGYIPAIIGGAINGSQADGTSAIGTILTLIGVVAALAIFVWNTCMKGGNTGYSIGKGALGIKLIGEQTGQPIGAGMAFVRYLCHIIDGIPCYLGYLWPLWDSKRQTFADKIMKTIVVNQPKG